MNIATYLYNRFIHYTDGVAATEYALLMGFIALTIFGAVTAFGEMIFRLFQNAAKMFPG